jgi:hypothetical protein
MIGMIGGSRARSIPFAWRLFGQRMRLCARVVASCDSAVGTCVATRPPKGVSQR